MILRIENIDLGGSITITTAKIPEVGELLSLGDYTFVVETVTEFTSHTMVIVRMIDVIRILPSQLIEVSND